MFWIKIKTINLNKYGIISFDAEHATLCTLKLNRNHVCIAATDEHATAAVHHGNNDTTRSKRSLSVDNDDVHHDNDDDDDNAERQYVVRLQFRASVAARHRTQNGSIVCA